MEFKSFFIITSSVLMLNCKTRKDSIILPKMIFLLTCSFFITFSSAQVPGLTERNLMKPTGWYWLTGVSANSVKQKISEGYRIIDLQIENTSPLKFSAAFVKNSGSHKKSWWWYYGKSGDQIEQLIKSKKARIIDLEIYHVGGVKKYAVVMVSNKGVNAKGWWYYSQLNFDQIKSKLRANKARLVDLDTYVKGGKRYFSAVMIKNAGKDAKSWWYYSNLTATQIKQKLAQNKARITDIEIRKNRSKNTFVVIMEKLEGESWWWYYGKTLGQIKQLYNQNGARIVDIEPYKNKRGKKRFAVAMLRNSNDATYKALKSLKMINDLVNEELRSAKIPGMTVAVSKKGRLVFNNAYGYANYEKKTPMETTHASMIGSVSKILTTLGVMKLTQQKPELNISSKVYGDQGILNDGAYKQAFIKGGGLGMVAWYKKMELRHLLSHTSGFVRSGDVPKAVEMFRVPEEELTYKQVHLYILTARKLLFEPGTVKKYSNHGAGLTGHIISEISGMSYDKYVTKHILKPLGLTKVIPRFTKIKPFIANPHKTDGDGKIKTLPLTVKPSLLGLAAGGWLASARDLARIMVATDKLSNYPDILSAKTIDLMETKPFPNVPGSYALGWTLSCKNNNCNMKKLGKDGRTKKGGNAYIVKFSKNYVSSNGAELSDINIAICTNTSTNYTGKLKSLANKIALQVGKIDIPVTLDLF